MATLGAAGPKDMERRIFFFMIIFVSFFCSRLVTSSPALHPPPGCVKRSPQLRCVTVIHGALVYVERQIDSSSHLLCKCHLWVPVMMNAIMWLVHRHGGVHFHRNVSGFTHAHIHRHTCTHAHILDTHLQTSPSHKVFLVHFLASDMHANYASCMQIYRPVSCLNCLLTVGFRRHSLCGTAVVPSLKWSRFA